MSHEQLLYSGNGNLTYRVPDPEVTLKAKRRTFPAEYKLRILNEAAQCRQPSERGALLRREGLYSSHLTNWRRELRDGALAGVRPKKRGPKAAPLALENAQLRCEIEELRAKLERAETIIEVQKKLSSLLGVPPSPATTNAPL